MKRLVGLLGLLLGLCLPVGALAFGESATQILYSGDLVPNNLDDFIPIRLELPESDGRVTTLATLGGVVSAFEQRVTGDKTFGQCNLKLDLGSRGYIHLAGSCDRQGFFGKYTWFINERPKKRGTFRLSAKVQEEAKKDEKTSKAQPDAHKSMLACIKQSSSCLFGCPKDDEEASFLCVNHCRHKEQECKKRLKDAQRMAAP